MNTPARVLVVSVRAPDGTPREVMRETLKSDIGQTEVETRTSRLSHDLGQLLGLDVVITVE